MAILQKSSPMSTSTAIARLNHALPSILLGTLFNVLDAGMLAADVHTLVTGLPGIQSLPACLSFLQRVPLSNPCKYKACPCTYSGLFSMIYFEILSIDMVLVRYFRN